MRIPVVLAINDAYLNQAKVVIYSLYDNAHDETHYDVYILHYKLKDETQQSLQEFYLQHTFRGTLTFLGLTDEQWSKIPLIGRWGKETNYRLFLASILPHVDKIIYLDADVLVLDDLQTFFQIDLKETAFGSVTEDIILYRRFHIFSRLAQLDGTEVEYQEHWSYINAGILLLNLAKLREIDLEHKALKLLTLLPRNGLWMEHFYPLHVDFLIMPDQDVLFYLAYAYTEGITYVPQFYNYLLFVFRKSVTTGLGELEYKEYLSFLNRQVDKNIELPEKPVMIHFAAMHPWEILHIKVDYADRYHDYAKKIGWNTTKNSWLYFFAKIQNYIKHRLILPDFKQQIQRIFKKV